MATRTSKAAPDLTTGRLLPAASGRRWGWVHLLALAGAVFLVWETWTVVAWLADGPRQVTEYRDSGSTSWYAARGLEGLTIVVSCLVLVHVVRGCFRERKILTFDVMFCLAGGTMVWADFASNFFVPTFVASSNFVNLENMCGHIPLVVNPECGKAPDPLLFLFLLETFGILGAAIVVQKLASLAQARWPGIPRRRMIVAVIGTGLALDLLLEPVAIALHLWHYPAPARMSLGLGGGFRYPIVELFAAGGWFGLLFAVRTFRDDRGRTLVERGLDHHPPRRRKALSMLALYGYFQLAIWVVASVPLWFYGPYEPVWRDLPPHIVNGICDVPGASGSRYGPCPGAPGFRMPGRGSFDAPGPAGS